MRIVKAKKRQFSPFHLTVNKAGLVSLWDSAEQAQRIKGESYVVLELTKEQVYQLLDAATKAKL